MNLPDAVLLLAAADAGRCLPPAPAGGADPQALAAARAVQAQIATRRRARGERPVGWKIGFTNRSIWPLYGVHQPIWGPVWDTTLHEWEAASGRVSIARLAQPRLEPEIVFGLSASPPPQADARDEPARAALLACVAWVAHGVEIVHSVWPDWRFGADQAIAAQALHGALVVGPKVPLSALGPDPASALAGLVLTLSCDGRPVATGTGAAVLDGPLQALGHLVAGRAAEGERLAAGSVITTGTLTDAQPLIAGQTWTTQLQGVPLHGLTLQTVG